MMRTTEPSSPVSFCCGSSGTVEQIRSVQVAVKRLRCRDDSLRHLWLQKGVLLTQAEARDLFLALQQASAVSSPSSIEQSNAAAGSGIQSVRICRGFHSGLKNIASWRSVIAVLSRLSNLEELIVDENLSVRDSGSLLDMLLLLHPRMARFRRLQLNARHSIVSQSMPMISSILRDAEFLVEFMAHDLVVKSSNLELSPLLTSLSTLPNLMTIDIGANMSNGRESPLPPALCAETFFVVLQSQCLSSLALRGFQFGRAHVEALTKALSTNTALRQLHLSFVTFDLQIQEESVLDFLVQMTMDQQFTLQSLLLETNASQSRHLRQLDTLCALNRANRRAVVNDSSATRQDWVQLLWEARDDVNALYYLLLKNPCLCKITPTQRNRPPRGGAWRVSSCARDQQPPKRELWPSETVIQVDV